MPCCSKYFCASGLVSSCWCGNTLVVCQASASTSAFAATSFGVNVGASVFLTELFVPVVVVSVFCVPAPTEDATGAGPAVAVTTGAVAAVAVFLTVVPFGSGAAFGPGLVRRNALPFRLSLALAAFAVCAAFGPNLPAATSFAI